MFNTRFISLCLLLALGFIWGTGYSIARFATTHGVSPLGYSFWQCLGPALLISLLSFRITKSPLKTSVSHLRYYFICGLTGIVIPNTNMYFSASHLPAGLLAVIVNTVPIFVYIMSLLAKVEAFNFTRLLGIFSGLCGLTLIIIPSTSLPSQAMSTWVLSSLITPLSFAFCAVYIARFRPEKSDTLPLAAGMLIASCVLLSPFMLLQHNFYALHWPLTSPDLVILLEIILSSIGYILLFQLIKIAGPVYYSLVDTVVALTGLFWGYILFHEQLNEWTFLAVMFILLALYLVTKKRQPMIDYKTPIHSQ